MRLRIVLLAAASLICATAPLQAKTQPKHHHKAAPKHHLSVSAQRGIAVTMDEVRVVAFQRPIATVFVGNPTIADATVIDAYHAFVLGKGFGTTNLIALGPQSQTVANQQITVTNHGGGVVTLNKGSAQYSYACSSAHCEANPVPGDQKGFFDEMSGSANAHQDQAVKAANVAAAQH